PPPGNQMRIAKVLLQGRHDGPGFATTTQVASSYQMRFANGDGTREMSFAVDTNEPLDELDMGDWRIVQHDGIGRAPGNWELTVVGAMGEWSPCGQPVTLAGGMRVSASSDDGATDAEIAVQRSDVSVTRGLAWGWQFRRCTGGGGGGGGF